MQGEDRRDEILRQAAELRARSAKARGDAVRIMAKSRQLMTQGGWTRCDVTGAQTRLPGSRPDEPEPP